ncbi:hypothetical protein ASO20_02865 [Mycoplasma sp. (ex Biomphalaria glabrata)]|uniref:hypothetical protein n=1 Tax=Mycoplasma sp. (ex Biomphalaria glabrata) TaxID=1749074 RepID=UPI00073A7B2D|nr:hypothetical protein [Mycoplasma sp. (ex Biomphalaria glabrata)]ALV23575.1 hypothetical protein ASO20_02865 [Mycoplasma sp. (ex Biomphalaria glabrata)]
MENTFLNDIFAEKIEEKFTDKEYLSKQEIMQYLGHDYNENVWKNITNYRLKLRRHTDLSHLIRGVKVTFFYTYSHFLIKKMDEVSHLLGNANAKVLEMKINNIVQGTNDYAQLIEEYQNSEWNLLVNTTINENDLISSKNRLNDQKEIFANLFSAEYFQSPEKYDAKLIHKWLSAFNIYHGYTFRKKNYIDSNFYTTHVRCNDIPSHFQELISYVNENSKEPLLIKASLVFLYVRLGIIFEEGNDIAALLSFYYVIAKEYPNLTPFILSAQTIINNFASKISLSLKHVNTHDYDATFIIIALLNMLETHLKGLIARTHINKDNIQDIIPIEKQISNLHENFPLLTQKELEFYVKYAQENKYYDVKDYQKFASCSYETARTSMQSMNEQNLLEKIKISKKFVYKKISKQK